jgi:hypothetical protein
LVLKGGTAVGLHMRVFVNKLKGPAKVSVCSLLKLACLLDITTDLDLAIESEALGQTRVKDHAAKGQADEELERFWGA